MLTVTDLKKIDKLMELYEGYTKWDWRFGNTPDFQHTIEIKLDWALLDIQFDVEKGIIVDGQVFSDCLIPQFIDELNQIVKSKRITYDENGIREVAT